MNGLDQQKALAMMDLNADATRDEISKRYGVLTRKFRSIKKDENGYIKDENGYTIEDITEAYNLLVGITFIDEKEEQRQKALRENPPLLARILKKDPVKLENFFHYYKWHMIIGIAALVLVFFSIRSCVNQVHPDFTLVLSGNVYAEDGAVLEADILQRLPEVTAPQVHLLTSNPSDGEYNYAIQMKQMAMLAAAEIDVIMMDQAAFDLMVSQSILLPLEDHMGTLPYSQEKYVQGAPVLEEPDDGESVLGPVAPYGVDITESEFVKKNNILGEKIIAGIVLNSNRIDQAISFLSKLN